MQSECIIYHSLPKKGFIVDVHVFNILDVHIFLSKYGQNL
jgi:hypothetical protein